MYIFTSPDLFNNKIDQLKNAYKCTTLSELRHKSINRIAFSIPKDNFQNLSISTIL